MKSYHVIQYENLVKLFSGADDIYPEIHENLFEVEDIEEFFDRASYLKEDTRLSLKHFKTEWYKLITKAQKNNLRNMKENKAFRFLLIQYLLPLLFFLKRDFTDASLNIDDITKITL